MLCHQRLAVGSRLGCTLQTDDGHRSSHVVPVCFLLPSWTGVSAALESLFLIIFT